jgi:hypothetical protein
MEKKRNRAREKNEPNGGRGFYISYNVILTCMRFGMCINLSENPSVFYVGKSIGVPIGDCGTIP